MTHSADSKPLASHIKTIWNHIETVKQANKFPIHFQREKYWSRT